jgi:6-phosphogluconolactonase
VNVRVLEDPEAVAAAASDLVAGAVAGDLLTLVLVGGSTPRRTYQLLAGRSLPWGRVTVLFGDERCVPPDDPESNYRMAREELLDRVHPGGVHRMAGELGAEAAAELYGPVVRAHSPLDMVLLGMGPDGHTASLFPGRRELEAAGCAVAVHDAPKPPPDRVSLTLSALRGARRVVLLVTGADKAEALEQARRGAVPAGMIPGAEYLVDRAAASRLG